MNAWLYSIGLQWKLDIRSRSLLVTCYLVPLLFFLLMGGIFTSLMPDAKETLLPSMTVMGVSMGALIGLPPSLAESYGSDIRKAYRAGGAPLCLGLVSTALSTLLHLLLLSAILYVAAPLLFGAAMPKNAPAYAGALGLTILVSIGVGSVLGLSVRNQSKLTMVSQLVFLPSLLLSGILFPASLLPAPLRLTGKLFPATWGYALMQDGGFYLGNLWPPLVILLGLLGLLWIRLRRLRAA